MNSNFYNITNVKLLTIYSIIVVTLILFVQYIYKIKNSYNNPYELGYDDGLYIKNQINNQNNKYYYKDLNMYSKQFKQIDFHLEYHRGLTQGLK